jgi:uncharacterized membrane protein YdfJ with MMPL/SSD domain
MTGPLHMLTLAVIRARTWVLCATAALAVLATPLAMQAPQRFKGGGLIDEDAETSRVRTALARFSKGDADVIAVYQTNGGSVDAPESFGAIVAAIDRAEHLPHVAHVQSDMLHGAWFLTATDRSATAVIVTLRGNEHERLQALPFVTDALAADVGGVEVSFTGLQAVQRETITIVEHDLLRGELVALPVAALVLLWLLGSLAAALVPVLIGLLTAVLSLGLLSVLASYIDINVFATNIVTLVAVGLGIDAGLFLVARFREERASSAHGSDVEATVVRTALTAGRSVLFSNLAVALAMAGLLLFPLPLLRSLGIAGLVTVLILGAVATVVMPALLACLGHRLEWGRVPWKNRAPGPIERDVFFRIASFAVKHPWWVLVVVGGCLVAAATPFSRFEPSALDHRSLPADNPLRIATEQLSHTILPNLMTPHEVLLGMGGHDVPTANEIDRAFALHQRLAAMPGVARVLSVFSAVPGVSPTKVRDLLRERNGVFSADERLALSSVLNPHSMRFIVLDQDNYNSIGAMSRVRQLRGLRSEGLDLQVGGASGGLVDFIDGIQQRVHMVVLFVWATMALVLAFAFRSLVLPIKALLLTTLSLTASFGALVWIFQDGRFADVLRYQATGLSDAAQPVFLFCFVFGMSMDYEVILLSRIIEEIRAGTQLDVAVCRGLARSGRLFSAAALLFILVVVAFSTSEILTIKQLGFGMALAVALDATILRALLVPAFLVVLGRYNWWPGELWRQSPVVDVTKKNKDVESQ